jgi:hypothetical protein
MITNLLIMLAVLWIFIYSVSFGIWTWKTRNKLGGVMVICFAVIAFILPAYLLFFL